MRAAGSRSAVGAKDAMGRLINRIKELSGIYRLGFERESILGIAIPVGVIVVVGAIGWFFIRNFL